MMIEIVAPSLSLLSLQKPENFQDLLSQSSSKKKSLLCLGEESEVKNGEVSYLDLSRRNNTLSKRVQLLSTIANLSNTELEEKIGFNELCSVAAMSSPIQWELEQEKINAVIAQYQEKKKSLQNPLKR